MNNNILGGKEMKTNVNNLLEVLMAKKEAEKAASSVVVSKDTDERKEAAALRLAERIEERLTQKGKEAVAQEKINKAIVAKKVAGVLDSNKKRLSVKGQTNILNIVFNGYSNDPDEIVDPSAMIYLQTMESELLRGYKVVASLVDEHRFMGTKEVQTSRYIKNIQDNVVVLTVRSNDSVGKNMYRIIVADSETYVQIDNGQLVGIISGKEYDSSVLANNEVKVYEGLLYSPSQEKKETITCFKVYEGSFADYNEAAIAAGEKKVISILNNITNGMLNILKKRGKLNFKKAVKCNARLSQVMAPSEVIGEATSYTLILDTDSMSFIDGGSVYRAVTMNKWLRKGYFGNFPLPEAASMGSIKQYRPLGVKGAAVGVDDEFIDIELSKFNVVVLKRSEITAEDQADLEAAFEGKGKYAPVYLKLFNGEIYRIDGDKLVPYAIADAKLKADLIASFNGAEDGRFNVADGVIKLITAVTVADDLNSIIPDFITDLNGFKDPVDFTRVAKFVMLDESKAIDGVGRLSMQMASTLLLSSNGLNYLSTTIKENINDSFDRLMSLDAKSPVIEEFNNFFLTGQMQSTAKNFVLNHDAPAFRTMINHWLNGQIGNITRFNVLTKHSGFARLTSDWSVLLANLHILDEGEAYSEDVNQSYEKMLTEKAKAVIAVQPIEDKNRITKKVLAKATSIDAITKLTSDEYTLNMAAEYFEFKTAPHTTIIFRSPKMLFAEFSRLVCLTKKQVEVRIRERVSNKRVANTLIRFFHNIKPGTFVLPAFEKYKELLGGADFDFDGVTVICDQDFIKAMESIEPKVVSVVKNAGATGEKIYEIGNFKTTFDMFMTQIFNGNMGIGQITNMNQLVELLLFVEDDIVRKIFRKNFKHESINAIKPYVSPLAEVNGVTEINDSLTSLIVDRIKDAELKNRTEINSIIFDLNVVLRGYQERTIDASKSAEIINVLFNLLQDCTLLCLADGFDVSIDWANDKVVNKVDRRSTKAFKLKKGKRAGEYAFIINDEFHKIMVEACDLLAEKAEELIAHHSEIKLTADHLTYLSEVHKKYSEFDESLINISNRYKEANGIRISKVNALRDKDGNISKLQRKVVLPDIAAEYNATIAGLTNMTRELLKSVPAVERAALVKYIAIHSKNEEGLVTLNENGGSSICHTILPEEYLMLVMKLDDKAARFARSKVFGAGRYNEGDKATVSNGISVEENSNIPSFVAHKDLNGTYTIEKDNDGAAYLVEDIDNLININMPERRTVVVRLFPKTKGAYKSLIAKLEENPEGIKLSTFKGGKSGSYDKVEVIKDGIIKPLSKFQAPNGQSPLGKMMDGFVGRITSINYNKNVFKSEIGESRSFYTILVVAEEEAIDFRRVNPFDSVDNSSNPLAALLGASAPSSAKSASDLFKNFTTTSDNKTTDTNNNATNENKEENKDESESILNDFGGHVDNDILNFLSQFRK